MRAGRPGAPGLAEPAAIRRAAHAAAFGLLLGQPGKSAAQTLSEGQRRAFLQGSALLGAAGLMAPDLLVGVCGFLGVAVFGAVLLFRIWLYLCGLRESGVAADPDTAPADEDSEWLVCWPLQSIAMGRALYGLAKCPHFWARTPHRA